MKKLFPQMCFAPDARAVCAGIPYWFFAYFLWPSLLSLASVAGVREYDLDSWLEIGYHGLNFLVLLLFFLPYLKESFLQVQLSTGLVLKTAAIGAVVIVVLKLLTCMIAELSGNMVLIDAAFGTLMTTEAELLFFPTALISARPIVGTLVMIVLAPLTLTCMYYACVFAPVCGERPWLAYLLVAVLPVIPRLSLVFCLWPMESEITLFLIQIPIHLVACWTYQKTDTVWTPIFVHCFANTAILAFLLRYFGVV